MDSCPAPEQLQWLLSDRLTGLEAKALEGHVETCLACQRVLEELTGAGTLVAAHHAEKSRASLASGQPAVAEFIQRLEALPPPLLPPLSLPDDTTFSRSSSGAIPLPRVPPVPAIAGYE